MTGGPARFRRAAKVMRLARMRCGSPTWPSFLRVLPRRFGTLGWRVERPHCQIDARGAGHAVYRARRRARPTRRCPLRTTSRTRCAGPGDRHRPGRDLRPRLRRAGPADIERVRPDRPVQEASRICACESTHAPARGPTGAVAAFEGALAVATRDADARTPQRPRAGGEVHRAAPRPRPDSGRSGRIGPIAARPSDALWGWGSGTRGTEGQGALLPPMPEPRGALVDDMSDRMGADAEAAFRLKAAMTVAGLREVAAHRYRRALWIHYAARFRHVSEEKLAPRPGKRATEDGAIFQQPAVHRAIGGRAARDVAGLGSRRARRGAAPRPPRASMPRAARADVREAPPCGGPGQPGRRRQAPHRSARLPRPAPVRTGIRPPGPDRPVPGRARPGRDRRGGARRAIGHAARPAWSSPKRRPS